MHDQIAVELGLAAFLWLPVNWMENLMMALALLPGLILCWVGLSFVLSCLLTLGELARLCLSGLAGFFVASKPAARAATQTRWIINEAPEPRRSEKRWRT